ncbi:MAG: ribonuclease III [Clostridiales Family XIII bacterium]|jgi:ribonuclease-3 family protein|nr:ribonuclease III [Clostridiales Family XIII bacterium]
MQRLSSAALAFVGDAAYEVFVRERLARAGLVSADRLHHAAVRYVRASAQAKVMRQLLPRLSGEDAAVVRRARNHKPKSMPKNADPVEYKWATAFEALAGWYHMSGRGREAEALFAEAMRIIDDE